MNRLFILFAVLLLGALSSAAQQQSQQNTSTQAPSPTVRSTANEVVLDMVFRDKKGRAIHDIRPEEIHVLEDGVEQKVTSFHLVEGKPGELSSVPKASAEGGSPVLDPMREVRLVTLVFEGLDQEGKRFFRQSLKDILDMAPEQNLYFSIVTVDHGLQVLQPLTSDHAALLKSMDRSMTWSFTQYENQSTEVKQELQQTLSGGEPQLQASSGGGPSQAQVQSAVNYQMAKMQYDMLTQAEAADRAFNARATIDALMALVRAQSQLPGRKVVLYFNPWLFIPEAVKEQYNNLVSVSNRANVSFYTVDPKGLVTWSQNSNGRDWLNGAAGETRSQQMRGGVG
ncbi:MAG TPA: VWA domain-containing protein, partial [Candidatus Acidoferrum sp.]|nr:VWA domain-containing protein [Candidatus Acidoferrum sp.]